MWGSLIADISDMGLCFKTVSSRLCVKKEMIESLAIVNLYMRC